MSIRLRQIRPNFTEVQLTDLVIWFSYETPIAFRDRNGYVVSENIWGPTTGKHLNHIEPDKSKRVSRRDFEKRLSLALGDD